MATVKRKDRKEHSIWIIGCGPGNPDYMIPAALKAIREADVIAGAGRLLKIISDNNAERLIVDIDINRALDEIERCSRTKTVAVLVTGDPGLFSLAKPIIARFGRERCRIIPGVSSLQAAFARLALDWHDVHIIDAHGGKPQIDPASLTGKAKIAVFTGHKEANDWLMRLTRCLGGDYRLYVCKDLTLQEETVREITPDELQQQRISARAIVIFIRRESWP